MPSNSKSLSRKARRWYFRLSVREKGMLTLFCLVLLLIGFTASLQAGRKLLTEHRATTVALNEQRIWLEQRERIAALLDASLERLDPEQTYSASQLAGRIDEIAGGIDLSYRIQPAATEYEDAFRIHSIQISFRRAPIDRLIQFDAAVQNEAPYIGLERARIWSNRGQENLLDANYLITSFELEQRAAP